MAATDFKDYIYVSNTKIEQYLGQMADATLSKVSSETKFKTPLLEHTVKAEFEGGAKNRYAELQVVVSEIERRGLVGDLLDYKPWFRQRIAVKVLLVRDRLFYVGRIRGGGVLQVNYAFQCSISNHVGFNPETRAKLEHANSHGLDQLFRDGPIPVTLPGVTSSNWMFADALYSASDAASKAEPSLVDQAEATDEYYLRFFPSKREYELYLLNMPSDYDYELANTYPTLNRDMYRLMRCLFGGYRRDLVDPPRLSLLQTLKNIFGARSLRLAVGAERFSPKMSALKKLHNIGVLSARIRSDAESSILHKISAVASPDADTSVEIFGRRLLDGYYRNRGGSDERVILGSPLYLA